MQRRLLALVGMLLAGATSLHGQVSEGLEAQVVIRRDRFGVPHILAESEEAAAFAHGYVTAEDHGAALARLFLRARGELASVFGPAFAEQDIRVHVLGIHAEAQRRLAEMPPYMQGIAHGYAAGYNVYLARHRGEFPEWAAPVTGVDVLAHARAVLLLDFALNLRQLQGQRTGGGSNMWAVGRPRSHSGHGLLLANPHVTWDGATVFHEVHLTVPGVINVSGAALIGLPVVTIGFNESLGWTHTVNVVDSDDLYVLTLDESQKHYAYDGRWLPLTSATATVDVRTDAGVRPMTFPYFSSHYGPAVRLADGHVYAFKSANLGAVNFLTQWNAMGKAATLGAFRAALDMLQLPMFNVGYADRDGNIWYVFNGRVPLRPAGYDWAGTVPGNTSKSEWLTVRPIAELPQLLNPRSGYLQNCNDAPWYANLETRIDAARFTDVTRADGLGWRSQMSLRLLSRDKSITLEELMAYKFNSELPFAARTKAELLKLLKSRQGEPWAEAARVLRQWDNETDVGSRGAVLFLAWWDEYSRAVAEPFRVPWSARKPLDTPAGLADRARALEALEKAARSVRERHGRLDIAWGDTHRLRRGDLDLPVGGTPITVQNMQYRLGSDKKLVAVGGDSYVLAVEFTAQGPRAFSIVPHSEASNSRSPHFSDQAALYAAEKWKPAWFSEADIAANLGRQYRPEP